MKIELKNCPFCGRKMKVDYKVDTFLHTIRYAVKHVSDFHWSDGCCNGTSYVYETEKEAVDAWNRMNGEKHEWDI